MPERTILVTGPRPQNMIGRFFPPGRPATGLFTQPLQAALETEWARTPWVVVLPSSFAGIQCVVGREPRRILEPAAIDRVLDNALQLADDLERHVVGFPRRRGKVALDPAAPFTVLGRLDRCFALHRDCQLRARDDVGAFAGVDLTLSAYLTARIVLADERFQFDCGGDDESSGPVSEAIAQTLIEQWRPYLKRRTPGGLHAWKRWGVSRRSPLTDF